MDGFHESARPHRQLIKTTLTRCTRCFCECTGDVWRVDGQVLLLKRCPEHGEEVVRLARDERFYFHAEGDPNNRCCTSVEGGVCGTLGSNALTGGGLYEQLSSCITLIEIVDSCNIACPTCFSHSPVGKAGEHLKAQPLNEIKRRVQAVIDRKGSLEILQLSGGEPTIHPELFELFDWINVTPEIQYVFLNTNGIRFARDEEFAREFAKRYPKGKMLLYLQFDGPQLEGQLELRGADYRRVREEAIDRAAAIDIPVVLVATVTRATLPFAFETVRYGIERRHVRAAHFQPVFMSGRTPASWSLKHEEPISVGDVLHAIFERSNGFLGPRDFTPLPCGDPNCHTIGGVLRPEGQALMSISQFVDFSKLQDFLQDRVSYDIAKLAQCGCDNEELGRLLKTIGLTQRDFFFVSVKPFMDARTWDKDRTDRCCTHVIDPTGNLRSFCEYYSGF
jgi:uncharacterized radical SAM superfamily Fe-S cluster-containing enzyme